jgi:hypothetical protein
MRTANKKICVKKGTVSIKVKSEKIEFRVFEESQLLPQDNLECFNVCMIQGVVENAFQDHRIYPLEATLTYSVTRKDEEPVVEDVTEGSLRDSLHVPIGPITRARSKMIKEALSGLVQEIWAGSKMGHSKCGPKEDEGEINLIQAIDGVDLA